MDRNGKECFLGGESTGSLVNVYVVVLVLSVYKAKEGPKWCLRTITATPPCMRALYLQVLVCHLIDAPDTLGAGVGEREVWSSKGLGTHFHEL